MSQWRPMPSDVLRQSAAVTAARWPVERRQATSRDPLAIPSKQRVTGSIPVRLRGLNWRARVRAGGSGPGARITDGKGPGRRFRNHLRRPRRPGIEGRTRGMADVRRRKPVATTGQGILRRAPKRGSCNQGPGNQGQRSFLRAAASLLPDLPGTRFLHLRAVRRPGTGVQRLRPKIPNRFI